MQLVTLYPFDPTGRASANRIENQSITVTPPTEITDYSYVVPRAAPFYADSLVVKDGTSAGARILVENVDYWCVIDFLSASVALTQRVCVGIALLDPGYSGTLYVTYQAVGGNYTLADYSILEELIRQRYVVKHVSYEQIINLPEGFAPAWHQHEVGDMVGMSKVVEAMGTIKTALDGRQGSFSQLNALVTSHLNSTNSHTAEQVGLGNVKNYAVATLGEAQEGVSNKYVTAAVMRQFVTGQGTDTTGFITATTAAATFVTKLEIDGYYNRVQADGRFAHIGDTYNKAQVNALVSGFDVTSSLDGIYTMIQSDTRYVNKDEISNYIKTTVADGKFATKSDLNIYYTRLESDAKYPLKTYSYSRTESDERYLLKSSESGYLTPATGDGRYPSNSAFNELKNSLAGKFSFIQSTSLLPGKASGGKPAIPDLRIVENKAGVIVNHDLSLNFLSEYAVSKDIYNKKEVDDIVNNSKSKSQQVRFKARCNWNGYPNFELEWEVTRVDSIFYITVTNVLPFYYREAAYPLTTLPLASQNNPQGTKIRPISAFVILGSNDTAMNAFVRTTSSTITLNTTTGDVYWLVNMNHDENSRNSYIEAGNFFAGVTVAATSPTMFETMNKLITKGTPVTF